MIGKNMKNALIFLTKNPIRCARGDWTTFDDRERSTKRAMLSLEKLGYVEIYWGFSMLPMARSTKLGRLKARELGWIL